MKISARMRHAASLLLLVLLAPAVSLAPAHAQSVPSDVVDRLVLSLHPHGIGYDEARALGPDPVPRLLSILDDAQHKRSWVNALGALGFQEDPRVLGPLIEFYERTRQPDDLDTLRAHLAVPFAMGLIAANPSDTSALDFLRTQLSVAGREPSVKSIQGVDLTQARLERLIMGLSLAGQASAQRTLRNLPDQPWLASMDPSRRAQTTAVLEQAEEVSTRLASEGRSTYFSYHPPVLKGGSVWDLEPKGLPAPHQIAAKRHALTNYSNANLDADMTAATERLFSKDDICEPGGVDVACPVSFQPSGSVGTFGSDGDGLDIVTTNAELQAVLAISGARVKVVTSLDFCNGYNVTIIGCATIGGGTMVLEQGWHGTALFAHEFGHNRGLNHRNTCQYNMMSSSLHPFSDSVVNASECNAYGGAATLTLQLRIEGDGSGQVSVNPPGATCQSDCSIEMPYATQFQLQTHPDAGSIAGCSNGCSYSMLTGRSQTIRFLRKSTVGAIVRAGLLVSEDAQEIFADGFEPAEP